MKKRLILLLLAGLLTLTPAVSLAEDTTTGSTSTQNDPNANARNDLKQAISDLKSAKADAKVAISAQVLSKAKTIAAKDLNIAIAYFQRVETRVASMNVISDADKANVKSQIDAKIGILQTTLVTVQNATTIADVKAAVELAKSQVKDSNSVIKNIVLSIHKTHLTNITGRLTNVLASLNTKIAAAETNGKDMTEAKSLASEAQTLIDSANNNISLGNIAAARQNAVSARLDMVKIVTILKADNLENDTASATTGGTSE